jgi:hypothetical protein
VMDTDQPCLEISEDEMDDGQELLGYFGIATFGNGVVIVAAFPQAGVTAPIVRDDQRPRSAVSGPIPVARTGLRSAQPSSRLCDDATPGSPAAYLAVVPAIVRPLARTDEM